MTEPSPPAVPPRADWRSTRQRGLQQVIALFSWLAVKLGRDLVQWPLHGITLYYVATSAAARRHSRRFLVRALGRPVTIRDTYRHLHTFAVTLLDRLFVLSRNTRDLRVTIHGETAINEQARAGGFIVLLSHLGTFDVMRAAAATEGFKVSIVMDRRHGQFVSALLERHNPELAANIIDASTPGPGLMLHIKQALDAGRIVGVMADRVVPGEREIAVPFLGAMITLPAAPHLISDLLRANVYTAFGLYEGRGQYSVYFESLDAPLPTTDETNAVSLSAPSRERTRDRTQARQARVDSRAAAYAERLARYARQYPYNWFNFYDYFSDETTAR